MTEVGAGMTAVGAGMTAVGAAVVGAGWTWVPAFAGMAAVGRHSRESGNPCTAGREPVGLPGWFTGERAAVP